MITANKILKAIADHNSVDFVDNYAIFNKTGKNLSQYFDLKNGGYHPNSKGYSMIALNLYEKITEIMKKLNLFYIRLW